MRITGAIFDLDGTLLDSMPVWDRFGEMYLESRGVAVPENLAETLKTMDLPEAALYFIWTFGFQEQEDQILSQFSELLAREYGERVRLKDGVLLFLERLAMAGVRMCVATATDGAVAALALEHLGISGYFQFVLTCAEVGFGKNDPAIFQMALERLGTRKEQTAVFEDALHAAKTAKEAGFPVVGVFDPSSAQDREELAGLSDRYLNSFKEWEDGIDV